VRINLPGIEDESKRNELEGMAKDMLEKAQNLFSKIEKVVGEKIG
jgi:formiminotetrahydrofolate cyclodeaminase